MRYFALTIALGGIATAIPMNEVDSHEFRGATGAIETGQLLGTYYAALNGIYLVPNQPHNDDTRRIDSTFVALQRHQSAAMTPSRGASQPMPFKQAQLPRQQRSKQSLTQQFQTDPVSVEGDRWTVPFTFRPSSKSALQPKTIEQGPAFWQPTKPASLMPTPQPAAVSKPWDEWVGSRSPQLSPSPMTPATILESGSAFQPTSGKAPTSPQPSVSAPLLATGQSSPFKPYPPSKSRSPQPSPKQTSSLDPWPRIPQSELSWGLEPVTSTPTKPFGFRTNEPAPTPSTKATTSTPTKPLGFWTIEPAPTTSTKTTISNKKPGKIPTSSTSRTVPCGVDGIGESSNSSKNGDIPRSCSSTATSSGSSEIMTYTIIITTGPTTTYTAYVTKTQELECDAAKCASLSYAMSSSSTSVIPTPAAPSASPSLPIPSTSSPSQLPATTTASMSEEDKPPHLWSYIPPMLPTAIAQNSSL